MIVLYFKDGDTLKEVADKHVADNIYFQRARLPTEKQVKDYLSDSKKKDKKISDYFKKNIIDTINKIKNDISKVDYKIPLFDKYTRNMYLIYRDKVYDKVVYGYHRFTDNILFNKFVERQKIIEKEVNNIKKKKNKTFEEVVLVREHRKLGHMIDFLEQYNLDILESTYEHAFYFYSNKVGKDITTCVRPSFLPHFKHIKPYYTRSEIINLGLNMGIIKPSGIYYTKEKVETLCDTVSNNDISANTILNHQKHIIKQDKLGIIQYYTLQGSYFINQYMRNLSPSPYKNTFLEKQIRSLWELIRSAPKFDKDYIVYRFINSDEHLLNLKVGDSYTVDGILSTTRDPFYGKVYQFGYNLVKIKLPKGIQGVGLCVEALSNFPSEEEILLAPSTVLRLDKRDKNVSYYRTDNIAKTVMKNMYEFTYVKSGDVSFIDRPINKHIELVDFLKIDKIDMITVNERIKHFTSTYLNSLSQFECNIGKSKYTIIAEYYDSSNVYHDFYAATTNNGFLFYTIINNYVGFTIELGEVDDKNYMFVNYYFRYSSIPKVGKIDDTEFVNFIANVAYYFDISEVVIFCEYRACELADDRSTYHGGSYCVDFYNYFKYGKTKYDNFVELKSLRPKFSIYELDRLKKIKPNELLSMEDKDELYQIYEKYYKVQIGKDKDNVADFYIWLIENYCILTKIFSKKMSKIFKPEENPFTNDFYTFDAIGYLYNKRKIDEYTIYQDSIVEVSKNKYRIESPDQMKLTSRVNQD